MTRKITLYKQLTEATNTTQYTKNLEEMIEDISAIPYRKVNATAYYDGKLEIELEHEFDVYREEVRQFEESIRILIKERGYKRKSPIWC